MKSGILATAGVVAVGALLLAAAPVLAQPPAPPSGTKPTEAAAPAAKKAQAYSIDNAHSFVTFKVGHMGVGTAWGRFDNISGEIHFDPADLEHSELKITVSMASLNTGVEARDKHAKTADYLDVEKFANAEFVSQKITKATEPDTYQLDGELTFHGTTKPLSTKANIRIVTTQRGVKAGADTEFSIKPSEFGMKTGGLGEDVKLFVSIEAGQGEAGGRRDPGGAAAHPGGSAGPASGGSAPAPGTAPKPEKTGEN